jgi:protein-L-isoaspartate(D-aspartate) O-methyltransferase
MDTQHSEGIARMLADIRTDVAWTRDRIGKDALDPRVMQAMAEVPRDAFVPGEMQGEAYANRPLPIGHGQTISQPYIVALMTDLIAPQPHHRVLEIGTGSGYQTAILSRLCDTVYSIDLVPPLRAAAAARLARLGYRNIVTRTANGYQGWPEYAPYDGIIVTAAAAYIPQPLVDQLRPGGRMAIPVGEPFGLQDLVLVEKDQRGDVAIRTILGVAFVPMIDRSPEVGVISDS